MGIEETIRRAIQEEITPLHALITKLLDKPDDTIQGEYLTRRQVSKYLSIGLSTVDYWARIGKLHKVKFGNSIRFKKSEIDEKVIAGNLIKYKLNPYL